MASVPRIIPNTIDVHFRYTYQGSQCENVFQYIYTTIPTTASLQALALEIRNAFTPKYQAFMPQAVVFTEVRCDDIGAAGRATATQVQPAGTTGSNGTDPLPANVACSMILRTGLRGRARRGSKRISPFGEDATSGQSFLTGILSQLAALGVEILLKRLSNTLTPGVGSEKLGVTTPLTAAVVLDPFVDSQKTRLTGHGR